MSTKVKVEFHWFDDTLADVYESGERVGALRYHLGYWVIERGPEGAPPRPEQLVRILHVDPEIEEEFVEAQRAINDRDEIMQPVLQAELNGRLKEHCEETRSLGVLGAKATLRSWRQSE